MPIKVRVRNFQSVEDASIEIDGLTVVTGTNNAGKSAFFRAIRGAFTNSRGHDFVRYGKGHCTVDLTFDDGRTLTWQKGKNVNTYVVNGGKPFEKVGHGVPPEARVFGIEPVVAGKQELWPQIAPQITGVSFLLHETGSVIAEAVADVKRVNQLSRALSSCEKDRRAARSALKIRKSDAKTLAERREGFTGLDAAVELVEGLEVRRGKAEKVGKAVTNVQKLRGRYREAQAAVDALEGLEKAEEALPPSSLVGEARELSRALGSTCKLRDRWVRARGEVGALGGLDDAEEALPDQPLVDKAHKLSQVLHTASELRIRYQGAARDLAALDALEDVQEALPSDARIEFVERIKTGLEMTQDLARRHHEAAEEMRLVGDAVVDGLGDGEERVALAEKVQKALGNTSKLRDRWRGARNDVEGIDRELQRAEEELAELNEKVVQELGSLEECPTCGGDLDHVRSA